MSKGRISDKIIFEQTISSQHGPFSAELRQKARLVLNKKYGKGLVDSFISDEDVEEILQNLAGIGRSFDEAV